MKKLGAWSFKIFLLLSFSILSLFLVLSALFHTKTGQEYFLSYFNSWAQKYQIPLSLKEAEIISPFSFKLHQLILQVSPQQKIQIDSLSFRISPLPLLMKKLVFSNLSASNVKLISSSEPSKPSTSLEAIDLKNAWIDLPFALEISSLHVDNLYLQKVWEITGKAKIEKEGKTILFGLLAKPKEEMSSSFQLVGSIFKKTKRLHFRIIADTPSIASFVPSIYDASVFLQIDGKGDVDSLTQLLVAPPQSSSKIALAGTIKGKILQLPFLKDPLYQNLGLREGEISSLFTLYDNRQFLLYDLFYANDRTALQGVLFLDLMEGLKKCDLKIKTKNLSFEKPHLPLIKMEKSQGEVLFDPKISPFFKITLTTPAIQIGNQTLEDFSLSSSLHPKEKSSATATFFFKNEKGSAEAKFQWEEEFFHLLSSSITLPSAHASGSLNRNPEGLWTGRMEVRFEKMTLFYTFFPKLPFLAKNADLIVRFYPSATLQQEAQIQADLSDFQYKTITGKKAYLSVDTQEPFTDLKGTLKFLLQDAHYRDFAIKGLFLETSNLEENWPYEFLLQGNWREPLQIRSSGFWKVTSNELLVTIQTLSGHLLGQPFLAPEPFQWEYAPDHFTMKDFHLELASSSLDGSILLQEKTAKIHLHSEHFPIDFLSFNPLNLRVRGQASMDATILQEEQKLNSNIELSLEKAAIYALAEKKPLSAKGSLKMQVADNHFQVESHLALNQAEIMDFAASGQMHLNPFPFRIQIDKNEPIFSRLSYNGNVEELLDFFDLGTHRLEGHLQCQLELSKTLAHPELDGFCTLDEGVYENYYTGSYLKNLHGRIIAHKDTLEIEFLKGFDIHGGSLEAKGVCLIEPRRHFPFLIFAELSNLNTIQTDLIEAYTSGKLEIRGNSQSAKTTGQIEVTKASLLIPERIPPFLPDFPLTYRNHPFSQQQFEQPSPYPAYPLYLQLDLFAKDNIKISGKGLNAECNGTLKIEGSFSNLIAKGQLSLLHGGYSFAGRVFTLTEGTLVFPGIPGALPVLSIAGKAEQKGVIVTAHLKGPLNAPSLTFESLPPLPLSSIMSLLIFGQDISELSGIQAIQLATAIAGLSTGSGILETARKSLGIDRFTIISSPAASPDDSEKIAVQIGKYITKDVLVSLSQGTQEGSSNISVEVDLKHGFIFQAETLQEEEQSKFTIKWNINY